MNIIPETLWSSSKDRLIMFLNVFHNSSYSMTTHVRYIEHVTKYNHSPETEISVHMVVSLRTLKSRDKNTKPRFSKVYIN